MWASYKNWKADTERLIESDLELFEALCRPALGNDVSPIAGFEVFKSETVFSVLETVSRLSDYYIDRNPVLSAALHGIWDASRFYLMRRSTVRMFIQGRRGRERDIVNLRALVATAVIQHADGSAVTRNVPDPARLPKEYRALVDAALVNLSQPQ